MPACEAKKPLTQLSRGFGNMLKNAHGNMTMLTAISAIPIFLGVGVAVDSARINHEQSMFHAAVDSAVLAIAADDRAALGTLSGQALVDRMTELTELAEVFIQTNYQSSDAALGDIEVDLQITGQDVTLTASLEFPTSIMKLVGIDKLEYSALSEVKKAMRPIELAMVMDTTGSMASDNKLEGAVEAAKNLLNTLYGGSVDSEPRSEYIRVALVPFSGAVRLDTAGHDFKLSWIDTEGASQYAQLNFNASSGLPSSWNNYSAWSQVRKNSSEYHTWNGCVETRHNGSAGSGTDYNVNDAAPLAGSPNTLFPVFFNPDVVGSSVASNSYGVSYIGGTSTSATGSECRNLTSTVCSSTTTTNLRLKQENYNKYINANVGVENANPTSTTAPYFGPWGGCAVSKIVSLTHDRQKVEDGIDAMRSHGITIIPEGLAWGWRVLSPTEPFTLVEGAGDIPDNTISPYQDERWQKIMVLMTDGDNNTSAGSYTMNSSRYSSYGFTSESLTNNRFGTTSSGGVDTVLNNNTTTLCNRIKTAGITLYVASFGNDIGNSTKDMLEDCATTGAHYKHADTNADLQAFFDHIGEDVLNKSIYVSK